MFIYEVAKLNQKPKMYETKEALLKVYKQRGTNNNAHNRIELQGQPKLEGLLGPMYNGKQGEKTVIRYETQAEYDTYAD